MNTARLLVVEDDPALLQEHSGILEQAGHEVLRAGAGEDALRLCDREQPSLVLLILMDLSLAGQFDGLEATKRLRADPAFDDVPIVALTAHALQGDRERSLAAGCDEHWTKPIIDLAAFKKEVASAAARGRLLGVR